MLMEDVNLEKLEEKDSKLEASPDAAEKKASYRVKNAWGPGTANWTSGRLYPAAHEQRILFEHQIKYGEIELGKSIQNRLSELELKY